MDLDSFFVSVERLVHPQIVGKPVIIGGLGDRGVVSSCSYEARKYGVHSAMPMRMARSLCPDAVFLRGDFDKYTYYSHMVTDIIKESVPLYEKSSIDEFYIDMTGMDKFFGCFKIATALRKQIISETGLPISMGLSVNKTVSKIATGQAKPAGQLDILEGTEKPFLAPLSIRKIPMVGAETYKSLRNLGIEKIQTVQEIPLQLMEKVLGKNGVGVWQKANAIDHSPVKPYREQKSMSAERTFQQDTIDMYMLHTVIAALVEKLCFELRQQQKLTACLSIKIRYANFDTHTLQQQISYTNADHVILPIMMELFKKTYSRRMLIRLVGIKFTHLVQGNYQINMFDDTQEMIGLYQAIDRMKNRFGHGLIKRANSILSGKKV